MQDMLLRYLGPVSEPTEVDIAFAFLVRTFLCGLRLVTSSLPRTDFDDVPRLWIMAFHATSLKLGVATDAWRTPFLHRLSVLTAWSVSPPVPEYEQVITNYVFPSIIRYLDEAVIPADPEGGRKTRQSFVSSTLRHFNGPQREGVSSSDDQCSGLSRPAATADPSSSC